MAKVLSPSMGISGTRIVSIFLATVLMTGCDGDLPMTPDAVSNEKYYDLGRGPSTIEISLQGHPRPLAESDGVVLKIVESLDYDSVILNSSIGSSTTAIIADAPSTIVDIILTGRTIQPRKETLVDLRSVESVSLTLGVPVGRPAELSSQSFRIGLRSDTSPQELSVLETTYGIVLEDSLYAIKNSVGIYDSVYMRAHLNNPVQPWTVFDSLVMESFVTSLDVGELHTEP